MIRLSAFADEISQNPHEQLDVLSRHGISHIEFRAIHGTNVLDLTDSQHAEFRELLRERGVGLSAIGSPIGKVRITESFDEHLSRFDKAMELAEYYAAPRIRVFSFYMPPGDDPGAHRPAVDRPDDRARPPRGGSRHHALPRKREGHFRRYRRASRRRDRVGRIRRSSFMRSTRRTTSRSAKRSTKPGRFSGLM